METLSSPPPNRRLALDKVSMQLARSASWRLVCQHSIFSLLQAYQRLGKAVVDTVQAVAETSKNPEVMMFENFHHLYG